MSNPTIELWQAEWCTASHTVRQRLSELGLSYTAHQVPPDREQRTELMAISATGSIPVLRMDGETVEGEESILGFLDQHFQQPAEAEAHREKAARSEAKRRQAEQAGDPYAITRQSAAGFDASVESARAELAQAGFGVLCEIDVQATLRAKLGIEMEPYIILGACNPPLAHAALEAEPDLGVLLPCNVIVRQREGVTWISAVNARRMLSIVGNGELEDTAAEVERRLTDVVERAAA